MNKLYKALCEIDDIEVARTQYFFCEISNIGINKGNALIHVADLLNIPLESSACVGDSANDLPMFRVANTSYLVKDRGPDFIKQSTHFIKISKNKVANVINNYFFEK